MSQLTCISCNVRFATGEMQRDHYKGDWHRYNLKRRVANLPPVTAEGFQERVLQMRNEEAAAKRETRLNLYCNACQKLFSNALALKNHQKSKKHQENLMKFKEGKDGDKKEVTTTSVAEAKPHPALKAAAEGKGKYALKPVMTANNVDNNSDDDYELLEEEEVQLDSDEWSEIVDCPLTETDCLFCSHKSEDMVDNLQHMSAVHSFFIPDPEYCVDLGGLLSYLGEKIAIYYICLWCNDRGKTFYSLDAVRKHMVDKGHCQMLHDGAALAEYAEYYDYSSSYPDHEEGMDVDEEVVPNLLEGDEYQLVLPSGAIIGHRSLMRYYKQNLRPERQVAPKKSERKLHHLLSMYRSLGWTNTQQMAAARRARDIHVMQRAYAKLRMQIGCKANKLQKHLRPQVLF